MTTYGAYAEGRVKVGSAPSSGGKMGIKFYIIIGIAAALFVGGAYEGGKFIYHHEQAKMAKLQEIADEAKQLNTMMTDQKAALDKYTNKLTPVIKKKVVQDETQSQEALASGDIARIVDMQRRLHDDKISPAPMGGGSGAKPAPGAPASP